MNNLNGADLIDYPCAPDWVHHYARLGMTRDYPPEFYHVNCQQELSEIKEALAKLNQSQQKGATLLSPELRTLQGDIKQLKLGLRYTQKQLGEYLTKQRKPRLPYRKPLHL